MTFRNLIVSAFFLLSSACVQEDRKLVSNQSGGYAIEVLSDWDYSIKNSSTTAIKAKSLIVQATLSVSILESEYGTLEESFNEYVAQLPSGFVDLVKVGGGETQINGIAAMWYRMKDTEDGVHFENLVYVMQPVGRKMVVISCSSPENSFREYEEDFTSMAFSCNILKK